MASSEFLAIAFFLIYFVNIWRALLICGAVRAQFRVKTSPEVVFIVAATPGLSFWASWI